MKSYLTIPLLSLVTTACAIENKLHDLTPAMPAGECDLNNPITGSDDFQPVAICSASNEVLPPIRESVDIFGEESYDPNGYELIDYQWTLVERPQGSASPLGATDANHYGFTPDVVGDYVMELVVTNELCIQSDPCQVAVQAVPDGDMWVEMHWQHPNDDMDLHLVQNNAAYESDGDCYYGNCVTTDGYLRLDWGGSGPDDDPRLDLDDIDGVGPENINIADPGSGNYRVVVHDYPGSEMMQSNAVTVRIYIAGEIAYEETKTIEGEDSYVSFADISWPSGEINPL